MAKLHYIIRFEEKIVPNPKIIFFTFFSYVVLKLVIEIAIFFFMLHLTCQVGLLLIWIILILIIYTFNMI